MEQYYCGKKRQPGDHLQRNRLDLKVVRNLGPFTEIWVLSRKFGSFSRKFGSFSRYFTVIHGHSVLIGSKDLTERTVECAS